MLTAETVARIIRFDGNALPVTSLYARVLAGPGTRADVHARVSSLLDAIHPVASDPSLKHQARLSVRADIERIGESLADQRWKPGSIAIFACSSRGLYEEVWLPRAVRDRVVVDATPYVRPMLAVLDEYRRTCVAVVDKASAQVWELYQDDMREVRRFRDRALRKPNYAAGLAEDRVRNKSDELSKRHYRKVVQLLDELFRTEGFDLLIVGGHQYEIPAFTDFLPAELRSRLAGTISVDPDEPVAAEVRTSAAEVLQRYERADEERLIGEIVEKLATGALAAAGLDDCLWAGSIAAVQTLLVRDGAEEPGVVCDQSHWLARSGDTCPLCGNPTRTTPDVIDELAQEVIVEGGSVRHVEADGRMSEYAVAAALRFPLPPAP